MKCPDCGVDKHVDEFPRNRSTKTGRGKYCKPCHNARTRATIKRLHGDSRHYHYRRKYGIGRDDFDRLKREQGSLCAICGTREATQVDHDHRTGKVRALLCLNCNAGLGALGDDPRLIYQAIGLSVSHPLGGSVSLKRCPKCGLEKATSDFVKNRSTRDGIGAYCRPCHADVVRANIRKNHGSGRDFQLKRRYGVDSIAAAWLILQQRGSCAICRVRKPVHLDHCHDSQGIRGILCFNCNRALGYFDDDVITMCRAADYLESHS